MTLYEVGTRSKPCYLLERAGFAAKYCFCLDFSVTLTSRNSHAQGGERLRTTLHHQERQPPGPSSAECEILHDEATYHDTGGMWAEVGNQ